VNEEHSTVGQAVTSTSSSSPSIEPIDNCDRTSPCPTNLNSSPSSLAARSHPSPAPAVIQVVPAWQANSINAAGTISAYFELPAPPSASQPLTLPPDSHFSPAATSIQPPRVAPPLPPAVPVAPSMTMGQMYTPLPPFNPSTPIPQSAANETHRIRPASSSASFLQPGPRNDPPQLSDFATRAAACQEQLRLARPSAGSNISIVGESRNPADYLAQDDDGRVLVLPSIVERFGPRDGLVLCQILYFFHLLREGRLRSRAREENGRAWTRMSDRDLERTTALSAKQIKASLKQLQAGGWIETRLSTTPRRFIRTFTCSDVGYLRESANRCEHTLRNSRRTC
jgi:hypothetical protein